jgi:hypothetical protein
VSPGQRALNPLHGRLLLFHNARVELAFVGSKAAFPASNMEAWRCGSKSLHSTMPPASAVLLKAPAEL